MALKHRERSGGKFTACALCRKCMSVDVHDIRLPNPDPPKLIYEASSEYVTVSMASGESMTFRQDTEDLYDRWDERAYEIVRICVECGYEWGQQ